MDIWFTIPFRNAFARKYRSQSKTNGGAWISVEPEPGTLVINIGDMMQNFTNGQVLAFFYSFKIYEIQK